MNQNHEKIKAHISIAKMQDYKWPTFLLQHLKVCSPRISKKKVNISKSKTEFGERELLKKLLCDVCIVG